MKLKERIGINKYGAYPLYIFGLFAAILLLFNNDFNNGIATRGSIYLPMYYLDTRVGFVSRTFIGEIARVLTGDNITVPFIDAMIAVNIFVCIALISIIMGRLLKKNENSEPFCVLAVMFVFISASVRYYFTNGWTVTYDHYWLTCALLSILCLKNKYARWLIPLFSFVGIWINYGYVLECLPLIMILLIYEIQKDKSDRRRSVALFVVFCCVSVAASMYFIVFANNYLKMSLEQTHEYILNRVPQGYDVDMIGIDAYLFNVLDNGKELSFNIFKGASIKETIQMLNEDVGITMGLSQITIAGVLVPIAGFEAFWIYVMRRSRNKKSIPVFILTMLLPLAAYAASAVSTDDFRCLSFGLITQVVCVMYLLNQKNADVACACASLQEKLRKNNISAVCVSTGIVLYSCVAGRASWYCVLEFALFICVLLLIVKQKTWLAAGIVAAISIADIAAASEFGIAAAMLIAYDAVCMSDLPELRTKNRRTGRTGLSALRANKLMTATFLLILTAGLTVYEFAANKAKAVFFDRDIETTIKSIIAIAGLLCFVVFIAARFKAYKPELCCAAAVFGSAAAVTSFFYAARPRRQSLTGLLIGVTLFLSFIAINLTLPYSALEPVRRKAEELESKNRFVFYSVPALLLLLALAAS